MKLLWRLLLRAGTTTPPSFTVTLTSLTNATGGGTTNVYINQP